MIELSGIAKRSVAADHSKRRDVAIRPRVALIQAGLGSGGTEKVLARLAVHLDRQGYDISVLSIHGDPKAGYYPVSENVRVRSMAAELGPVAIRRAHRRVVWLRQAMRGQDLVLSCLTKINVQTAIAAVGLDVRRIASERNNFRKQRMNWLWRWTMPLALLSADAVVMQTVAASDALPSWARRRVRVIPNPVLPLAVHRRATPAPKFVAVGRLVEQKGFDILLRALRIACDQGHSLPLTLYGVGSLENALKDLAKSLDIQDLVAFVGRSSVPHDWTKEPGIFVLSSRFEGFPNVLIEAMSSGFAVLATRCDWGPSEIVTTDVDGLLVPTDDPVAMAEAMIRLHHDASLRGRLASAAQERAKDFAECRIMEQWEQAVMDVLATSADKPSGKLDGF